MISFPDLRMVLGEIPWAQVGAAAVRLYMPERMTQDLDILVIAADSANTRQRLLAGGFSYQGELSIGGSSWHTPEHFPIDVLECSEEWCEGAIQEALANLDSQGAPVLPLPFLVLMKFGASRAQDLADITRMLGQASPEDLTRVRTVFQKWLPDEMEDLESLITLGQLEMQLPPTNGSG